LILFFQPIKTVLYGIICYICFQSVLSNCNNFQNHFLLMLLKGKVSGLIFNFSDKNLILWIHYSCFQLLQYDMKIKTWTFLFRFDQKLKCTCCEITSIFFVLPWKFSNDVMIFYDVYVPKSWTVFLSTYFLLVLYHSSWNITN
jgi:hypothetical protein